VSLHSSEEHKKGNKKWVGKKKAAKRPARLTPEENTLKTRKEKEKKTGRGSVD